MAEMLQNLQNALVYLGAFVLVLSVVVFVHEFGHFRIGRWCGIAVKSFSIGLGSEWFGWTDKHGTRWKVSRIPLGGFVSWIDDSDGTSTLPASPEHQALSDEEARQRGHFRAQQLWKRAITVAAGPLTNFVFAIVAFAILALVMGRDAPRIDQVQPGQPASEAGLLPGDVVQTVDGRVVRDFAALQGLIATSPGQTLSFVVRRGDVVVTVPVTPRPHPDNEQVGMIGVMHDSSMANREPIPPHAALAEGASATWAILSQTTTYLANVVTGRESGAQIAGPLGILNVSGQVASSALEAPEATWSQKALFLTLSLLQLAAVLSVAVGFVNLLPIPILDGGHLLFYGIEALRGGKPIPPAAQEWAYRAGFAVMASLFLFATWNDITRLFPGAH
ncbi:MAG: RIP metalloprotease [Hyphomonadaceae bacterium]|nr:RIP metalloprotease [Hyphomonadaceae bacterium]